MAYFDGKNRELCICFFITFDFRSVWSQRKCGKREEIEAVFLFVFMLFWLLGKES